MIFQNSLFVSDAAQHGPALRHPHVWHLPHRLLPQDLQKQPIPRQKREFFLKQVIIPPGVNCCQHLQVPIEVTISFFLSRPSITLKGPG